MATTNKVGRNEPCPCGSGKKFKACCVRKSGGPSNVQWLIVAAVVVVLALALASSFRPSEDAEASICPPGQIWSQAHSHCH